MKCLIVIGLAVAAVCAAAQQRPEVIPAPKKIKYENGYLSLNKLTLYIDARENQDVVFALQELNKFIEQITGKPVKKATTVASATLVYIVQKSRMALTDTCDQAPCSKNESYQITIDQHQVKIKAASTAGLYYAVQTIRQLIVKSDKEYFLPLAEISDQPALPYRGVMMDFAHGGLPKVDEIKRQIDFLACWKANQYYLYNEVGIELKGFEALNYKQCYTQEEIKDIIVYARRRHIDVIPFVAFYGHLHDMLKQERFATLGIGQYGHELDPRKDTVARLMENWIQQYAVLFPSRFIHVGFDETWETHRIARESDSTVHAEALWLSHLTKVSNTLKKYGKTVLAWTDMSHYYPDLFSRMPQDVLPVVWEYAPDSVALHHYLDPVIQTGRRFFIQPAVSGWGHIYPAAGYTYDNIDLCLDAAMKAKALGWITSVWTDAVEPLVRPSWSFMAYGCAAAWQGRALNRTGFEYDFTRLLFPDAANELQKALSSLARAVNGLQECFGKNTANMPGGTIIESWSNPFDPYYLTNSHKKKDVLKQVRMACEEAEDQLVQALGKTKGSNKDFIESLRVTCKLMHYQATRFLWAAVISDRWDQAMLVKKQNNFLFYDIAYLCHGLIQDLMDELGSIQEDYAQAWLSENMPYRKNTMLGRFTVEYGLWQKLLLKVIDYRIKQSENFVSTGSFIEVFHPDF
jgi:hypothetical protein